MRKLITTAALDDLIGDFATGTSACARCVVGKVIETSFSEKTSNWRISLIQGSRCSDCLLALQEVIADLQAIYRVSFEASLTESWQLSAGITTRLD